MTDLPQVSLGELTRASFRIGCLGFGGPTGQIALMHRIFVEEKKWIDEERYLHGLNFCMLLPGPEAQQLATYVGWLLNGVKGGVIAGALFVIPGALVVFALSWLYAAHAEAPLVSAAFYGVKIAVLAIVAEAVVRIGKRALKGTGAAMIAAVSFAALFVFGAPFPLVIIAAAIIGAVSGARASVAPPTDPARPTRVKNAATTAALWTVLWLAPLALAFQALGTEHVLTRVGLLFSKLAVVTFGGAYAVLAYLQQQAVEFEGWLTAGQMIDGLGLAETTPGPLVLVNQFVGFLAGWNAGGLGLAAATAAMASWQTFAPSYVWIFAGAPYAERLRENAVARSALAAVTAAVLGVVANLALWFALHVLFRATTTIAAPWSTQFVLPDFASADPFAAALAAAAAIALIRFKVNLLIVLAICAAAGIARGMF